VIAAVRRMRGPVGRRAVIAAGMTGLLLAGVSAAEGADPHSPQLAPLGAPVPTPKLAEMAVSRYTGALTTGMRLLGQAVIAGRMISYRGVQVVSWLAPGGSGAWLGQGTVMTTMNVLHRTGQPPDGVLGLTPTLVRLLRSHYAVLYTGPGSAAGRPASIVELLRPDGDVAALFWLDKATALPLRRELFDDEARMTSVTGFAGLTVHSHGTQPATTGTQPAVTGTQPATTGTQPVATNSQPVANSQSATATPGLAPSARSWSGQLGTGQLAALRAQGWPIPAAMPGGLTLFNATQSVTATGRVVALAYSDGLSVVSLFVQRGKLPASLPGWRQTKLSGQPLFLRNPAEPDLTWSASGYVYTVVAAAPAATLAGVVDSLPHQIRPGFWTRMGRGAKRLLSWANPFR
jgi:sigma-E factor negative regulatory protein RseB